MASEREVFDLSGPLYLTAVDWTSEPHRRAVAACLVQGSYILERDRQERREGAQALAPPWWEFLQFQLVNKLVDHVDSSIFGAIFEYIPQASNSPRYVITFRGTITKGESKSRDLSMDLHLIKNGLHLTSRFEIAMEAVRNMVAAVGASNVWIAGHSLGSSLAMLAGRTMAKTSGIFLAAYLFNPPFISAPIERIKDKKIKHGIRIAGSFVTAGLTIAMKAKHKRDLSHDPFLALSAWIPYLFVHPSDHISSEYIGYFEHRRQMEKIGAGNVGRLATQNSIGGLVMSVLGGKEALEPVHLIPSASLAVNLTGASNFKQAHGIHQWWREDLQLESKLYKYV